MKRVLIFLILNFPLSILHSSPAQSAALERLRVGYPSPSANFYPLFATKEANLFEKYGFEPEMIYVQGVQLIAVQVAGSVGFLVGLRSGVSPSIGRRIGPHSPRQLQRQSADEAHGSQRHHRSERSPRQDRGGYTLRFSYRFAASSGAQKLGIGTTEGREPAADRQIARHGFGHCTEESRWRRDLFSEFVAGRENGCQNASRLRRVGFGYSLHHCGGKPQIRQLASGDRSEISQSIHRGHAPSCSPTKSSAFAR